jgi:hypothetical protein
MKATCFSEMSVLTRPHCATFQMDGQNLSSAAISSWLDIRTVGKLHFNKYKINSSAQATTFSGTCLLYFHRSEVMLDSERLGRSDPV